VDIEVSGAVINPSPQTFNALPVLDGEQNLIELHVTV